MRHMIVNTPTKVVTDGSCVKKRRSVTHPMNAITNDNIEPDKTLVSSSAGVADIMKGCNALMPSMLEVWKANDIIDNVLEPIREELNNNEDISSKDDMMGIVMKALMLSSDQQVVIKSLQVLHDVPDTNISADYIIAAVKPVDKLRINSSFSAVLESYFNVTLCIMNRSKDDFIRIMNSNVIFSMLNWCIRNMNPALSDCMNRLIEVLCDQDQGGFGLVMLSIGVHYH